MLQLIYQDDNFVAVDKPTLWLTTPSRDQAEERPILGLVLQTQLQQQIFPVHRLDFEVSGLVLFAKNAEAHRQSQKWFEDGTVVKTYEALSAAGPHAELAQLREWQDWRSKLARGKRRAFEAPHGKPSHTRARVTEVLSEPSPQEPLGKWKWELQPLTGRSHQLRVEMFRHGVPIVGDALYSSQQAWPKGIALRAVHLDLSKAKERMGLPATLSVTPLQVEVTNQ
jgi:tRNA pseudouridine32 synthase/23S rRNA pseudouridine746 synthase